ncbi:hypothetical protein GGH97_003786, partial [Coemansia sp. RSA 475]
MEPTPEVQLRNALCDVLSTKTVAAQDEFIKFPSAHDEAAENVVRRFRSLSMSTKERHAWTEESVKR